MSRNALFFMSRRRVTFKYVLLKYNIVNLLKNLRLPFTRDDVFHIVVAALCMFSFLGAFLIILGTCRLRAGWSGDKAREGHTSTEGKKQVEVEGEALESFLPSLSGFILEVWPFRGSRRRKEPREGRGGCGKVRDPPPRCHTEGSVWGFWTWKVALNTNMGSGLRI